MDVVWHKTVMVNFNSVRLFVLKKEIPKTPVVLFAMKQVLLIDSAGNPMVNAGGAFLPFAPGHRVLSLF
jgi:hypothetical protein